MEKIAKKNFIQKPIIKSKSPVKSSEFGNGEIFDGMFLSNPDGDMT
jgi:hypothetical protein